MFAIALLPYFSHYLTIHARGLLKAIKEYTGFYSQEIKKADAGISDNKTYKNKANLINDFIEKAPSFEGLIYSGFKPDMVDVYGVDKLEEGDTFKFPSITSFSSSETTAKGFAKAGGGMFKIVDNKTAGSIRQISDYKSEDEVILNSSATYTLLNKTKNDQGLTIYEISEMTNNNNTYSEMTNKPKEEPKPTKDRSERWQPVAPLIIIKKKSND